MKGPWRALSLLILMILSPLSRGHEMRPAYLELREQESGVFAVLWKTPMRGDLRLSLTPLFDGPVEPLTPVTTRETGGAAVQTWQMKTLAPLRGQSLLIDGLDATLTDALVRIDFRDGSDWLHRFTPRAPQARIDLKPSLGAVAGAYLALGVEHILLGIDHLLFVLSLLLIIEGRWQLLKTLTAFTLAHSITLALATLGLVRLPSTPVEAVIALSIVFVAAESLRARAGQPGLTGRLPWLVAFVFGLLHGFGFAGALAEIGLPDDHIPQALLFFNVGVELGQLAFVAAVLLAGRLIRHIPLSLPGWTASLPGYAIGSVATFWLIQRVALF